MMKDNFITIPMNGFRVVMGRMRSWGWVMVLLVACSPSRSLTRFAKDNVLDAPALRTAHVGLSIYDAASGKYLYEYQADKYFIPASNTKIPTCYVAMKYLGDSIKAFEYYEDDTALFIRPSGDPSFLLPEFSSQRAFSFLRSKQKKIYLISSSWRDDAWGSGWSWNDYDQSYMAERSPFPIYGNVVRWIQEKETGQAVTVYSIPEVDWEVNFSAASGRNFSVARALHDNVFTLTEGSDEKREVRVPFVTRGISTATELLSDTLGITVSELPFFRTRVNWTLFRSEKTDSLLKPMMHRSDNFFAEQALLMVSDLLLGEMNDGRLIDSILRTDFADLPQRPRWADGSGLSRYNLFTPRDLVAILMKMKEEFGMDRIKTIFPTGGEGTISNYYKTDSGYIFAKTGTLSGVVAFSGFMYTRAGRLLLFSTIINNHQASATDVRRTIEKFLQEIRNRH